MTSLPTVPQVVVPPHEPPYVPPDEPDAPPDEDQSAEVTEPKSSYTWRGRTVQAALVALDILLIGVAYTWELAGVMGGIAVAVIIILFGGKRVFAPIGRLQRRRRNGANRVDALPNSIRLYPAPKPDFTAFQAGGTIYLVTHWIKAFWPNKTASRILTLAILPWCVILVALMPQFQVPREFLRVADAITLIFLLVYCSVRIMYFRYKARFNYTEMTILNVRRHEGWWAPVIIDLARANIVAQQSEEPNPLVDFTRIDIGEMEFQLLAQGEDETMIIPDVAYARTIRRELGVARLVEEQASLDALMAGRAAVEVANKLLPTITELLENIKLSVQPLAELPHLLVDLNRGVYSLVNASAQQAADAEVAMRLASDMRAGTIEANNWLALIANLTGANEEDIVAYHGQSLPSWIYRTFPSSPPPESPHQSNPR